MTYFPPGLHPFVWKAGMFFRQVREKLLIIGCRMNMWTYWFDSEKRAHTLVPLSSAWDHNVSITIVLSPEMLYSKFSHWAFVVKLFTRLSLIPKWDIHHFKDAAPYHCKMIACLRQSKLTMDYHWMYSISKGRTSADEKCVPHIISAC